MGKHQNIVASLFFVMGITLSLVCIVVQQFLLQGVTDYELWLVRWRWNNVSNASISLFLVLGSTFIHPDKEFIRITHFIQYLLVGLLGILVAGNLWGISTNTVFYIGYTILLAVALFFILSKKVKAW